MRSEFDVVVAGGGLAGSVAARELAAAGWSVLLAERKHDPGDFNYCAEAVSARSMADFDLLAPELIAAPIDGGILVGPSGQRTRLLWPGVGHILHRDRLMRGVYERALAAGAEGRLGCAVQGVVRDRGGRLRAIELLQGGETKQVHARALLCADGIAGAVGRLAGIEARLAPAQILICAQYRLRGIDCELGYPEFWIGDCHAPGGYAWVFPKGAHEANVGLAIVADRPSAAGRHATQWLKRFRRQRFEKPGEVVSYITGGIPTLRRPGATAAQGAIAAGDAARSADPLSAAGIAEAMHSARAAARCLDAALRADDLSAARLAQGDRAYRREHPRLATMARIRGVFDRLDDGGKEALCAACHRAFHERRVDDIDPLRMFGQLLRAAPALVGYARHLLFASG